MNINTRQIKLIVIFSFLINASSTCPAQPHIERGLLTPANSINHTRLYTVIIGEAGLSSLATIGLHYLWYKKFPHSRFHFFNDNQEWLQMDKVGHATTAYNIAATQYDLMRWSGVNNHNAAWTGSITGLGFLSVVEFFDGLSAHWGFSKGDMLANIIGSSLFLIQQTSWGKQKIQLRFSYHNSIFAKYNPKELGANLPQRLLKDYNGQTYWLSFNISSFLPGRKNFPPWMMADLGYSAEGMTGGNSNPEIVDGVKIPSFKRIRKYYFGLGYAFKTNAYQSIPYPGWINIFRGPTPVIEWKPSISKVKIKPFYF